MNSIPIYDPVDNPAQWWRRVCWVDERLATSGDLPENRTEALKHLRHWETEGITDVIDLRVEADDSDLIVENSGIRPHWFGANDDGMTRDDAWFDALTQRAQDILTEPGRKLLAHCHMGINRGPSALYAIMLTRGWNATEALDAIVAARPIAGIIYATDATRWWAKKQGHGPAETRRLLDEVAGWFDASHIDLGKVIRRMRQ